MSRIFLTFRPHFANFASVSTPGAMAGLVPDLERAPADSSVSEVVVKIISPEYL